ncbi:MAG: arginine decarboxylase [Flavobacteriaceae bacterium]|nr:MAG: arginine decarboxylase [Flavobacteriaceae bacterium]
MIKKALFLVVIAISMSSCVVLKEYEKVNINDPDMVLADQKSNRNVSIFHSYREASVGANGGETGGGCGCN